MSFLLGIVIPTYNESGNIYRLLTTIIQELKIGNLSARILVVDDNSPDGTADLVKDFIAKNTSSGVQIDLLQRAGKMGLASAYITGFKQIKDTCDYVMSMDADFSHKPQYLPVFLNQIQVQKADVLVGSRYIRGGGVENWGLVRKAISRFASIYASVILGVRLGDWTGGFNLYKTSIFEKLDLDKITSEGYLYQIEMKYKAKKLGFKLIEVPIIFPDRVAGKSKFNKKIIWEALLGVFKLRSGSV
jgi:dolichol-phosphate mannosyltransferase